MKTNTFLLLILFILTSCQGTGISVLSCNSRLHQAENLIWENPDSSLAILSDITPDDSAPSRIKARHALLTSMAMQGSGIIPESDSIARLAYEYYAHHGSLFRKMHAANCLAELEYEDGKLTDAIVHYHDALSCADGLQDVRMEGFLCQRLAELFALSYDHREAVNYAKRAVRCLNNAGEFLAAAFSSVDLARQHLALEQTARAETMVDSLLASNRFKDDGYDYYLSLLKADICNEKGDVANTIRYLTYAEETGYQLPLSSLGQFLLMAEKEGRKADRDTLINRLSGRVKTSIDSIVYQGILIQSSRLQENYRDAYLSLKLLCEIQDRTFTSVISQSATHALNAYFQEQYLLEQARRHFQYLLSATITILLLLLLSLSMVMLRHRRRQVENQMSRVDDLARDLQLIRAGKKHSDTIISTLVQEKIHSMSQLTEAYFSWTDEAIHQRESKEGRIGKDEILNQFRHELMNLRSDKHFLNSIEDTLNQTQDGIMRRLRSDFSGINPDLPKLKETDFQILLLFLAGFSNKSVSFFMDLSDEAVRSRKKRYKQLFMSIPGDVGNEYAKTLSKMPQ